MKLGEGCGPIMDDAGQGAVARIVIAEAGEGSRTTAGAAAVGRLGIEVDLREGLGRGIE